MDEKMRNALLLAADMRPYYARAISALAPTRSESCPTIGVDTSWRLYWNPTWVEATPLAQLASVIAAHEIEHLLRDHAGRRCERDHQRWNLAGDLEINDDCELQLPPGGNYPSGLGLPDGMLAEEYFERLPIADGSCCGSGAGSPLPGEIEPSGLALDMAAKGALVAAVRADVIAASASAPGSVPNSIAMWAADKPVAVRLPWPRLLANAIRGELGGGRGADDYSWSRLSRRQSLVIRPSLVRLLPRIALIVDTSGSMSDSGAKVLGIVRAVIARSGASMAAVIECDATAKKKRAVKNWSGGGGTDLREGFALLARTKRSLTIVVTDCESPWPELPVQNTVVVSTSTRSGPSWTRTIRI